MFDEFESAGFFVRLALEAGCDHSWIFRNARRLFPEIPEAELGKVFVAARAALFRESAG